MSAPRLQLAVALVNLGLLTGVAGLGVRTYQGSGEVPGLPTSFQPVPYALEVTDRPSLDGSAIWEHLGQPLPPPPPPALEPPPPTAPSWTLLLATVDPERPERSSGIVADPSGAQRLLRVGEPCGDFVLRSIDVRTSDAGREAVATLAGPDDRPVTLRLRRK